MTRCRPALRDSTRDALLAALLVITAFLSCQAALASTQTARQLGPWRWSGVERIVVVPDIHGAYADLTGLLQAAGVVDASSAATIDSIAARLRAVTGAEFAVVTLPTIGDYAASDVALAIGRAWGVGRAAQIGDATRNAGLVILLVRIKLN